MALLRERLTASPYTSADNPVFASGRGTWLWLWLWPNNIRTRLRAAIDGTEFAGTTPHTLRRTVATLIAHDVGLDAAIAQLGHSHPKPRLPELRSPRSIAPDVCHVLDDFSTRSAIRLSDSAPGAGCRTEGDSRSRDHSSQLRTALASRPDLQSSYGFLGCRARRARLRAIDDYDRVGQDQFLEQNGFGRPCQSALARGRPYDSKAILGEAYRHATGMALKARDFSGGKHGAAAVPRSMHFDVDGGS